MSLGTTAMASSPPTAEGRYAASDRPCVYEIPRYRPFMAVVMAGNAVLLVIVLVLGWTGDASSRMGGSLVAALQIAFYFYAVRWHRYAPYRVRVSAEGLSLDRLFGHIELPWTRVKSIRLDPHRRKPEKVAQAVISRTDGPDLRLNARIRGLDLLVKEIRELRPWLMQDHGWHSGR